jgi:hypothetical protein
LLKKVILFHLVEIIQSMFRDINLGIQPSKEIINKIYTKLGFRQGFILSTSLFNIYFDNVISVKYKDGNYIWPKTECLLY